MAFPVYNLGLPGLSALQHCKQCEIALENTSSNSLHTPTLYLAFGTCIPVGDNIGDAHKQVPSSIFTLIASLWAY